MNGQIDPSSITYLLHGYTASIIIFIAWANETNQTYLNHVWLISVFATGISTVALSLGFDAMAKYAGKEFYSIAKFLVYEFVYVLTLVKFAPVYQQMNDLQNFAKLWICAGLMWLLTNVAIHVLAIYFTLSESGSRRFSEIATLMDECSVLVSSIISIIMTLFWGHNFEHLVAFGPPFVLILVVLIDDYPIGFSVFERLADVFRLIRSVLDLGVVLSFLRVLTWAIGKSTQDKSIRDVLTVFHNSTHVMQSIQLDNNAGTTSDDFVESVSDLEYSFQILTSYYAILCLHRVELKYLYTSMRRTEIPLEPRNSLPS